MKMYVKFLTAIVMCLGLTATTWAKPVKHAAELPAKDAPMAASNAGSSPEAPGTDAHYAYLVDFDTGRVLYDKNGEERMPTSSMSKMMTMYLVFEQLKDGHLHLTDKLPVSERAWKTGGGGKESSDMFAQPWRQRLGR